MIDRIESNTGSIIKRSLVSMIFGVGIVVLGILIYIFQWIATPIFGFFISGFGVLITIMGVLLFSRRNSYGIDFYPDYFVIKKGSKETRIDKDKIEEFKIRKDREGTRFVSYNVYSFEIKHDGRYYFLSPREYKDLFVKMCAYFGVTPEEALEKEASLWEWISKGINK